MEDKNDYLQFASINITGVGTLWESLQAGTFDDSDIIMVQEHHQIESQLI